MDGNVPELNFALNYVREVVCGRGRWELPITKLRDINFNISGDCQTAIILFKSGHGIIWGFGRSEVMVNCN